MTVIARLRSTVARYPRLLWNLGAVLFINVTGFSFIWPITTIYIHEHLSRPVTVAGLVLLLYAGASSLGQLAGGVLFDRIGARRVIFTGLLVAAGVIALPGLVTSWPLYVAAMALFGFAQSLVFPAANALAGKVWPEGGRQAFNFIYVVHNAGVAVGTALGGVLANQSFTLVFLSTAAVTLLAAVLTLVAICDADPEEPGLVEVGVTPAGAVAPIPWLPISALLLSAFALWLVYAQWIGTLAVYMQGVGISLPGYSLLWTLNGVLIVFGQPLISLVVRHLQTLTAQLLLGNGLFVIAFGLLLTSQRYAVFVAAMVVLTLGEMLLWPGMPAAVDQLAPRDRRGFLIGLLGSATSIGRMFGPLLGGVLYDRFGGQVLLAILPWMLALPLASFLVYGRTVRRGEERVASADAA